MANTEKQSFATPTIPEDQAGLILHSKTRISAPASLVFRSLRNTETWKDWNKWVPRVEITYQPPEEDLATAAEIEELVRNTSIAGSYDSDLTDGLVGGGGGLKQRLSEDRPQTPPLRLRMNSQASRGSGSGNEAATSPPTNGGEPILSAAQKLAAAQAERRSSTASAASGASGPPPVSNGLRSAGNLDGPGFLAPNFGSQTGPRHSLPAPEIDPTGRRKSKTPSLQKAMKARQASLNLLYGEPSIRLQLHTRMTFYTRMNPQNPREYRQVHLAVTEVSRPDDPVTDGPQVTQLTRSKTHTLNRSSVYRIVWSMDNTMSSMSNIKNGSAFPKSLLVTERVHEIRPIILGDRTEECELKTWELQKGPFAKVVKKKYGDFLQKQFEIWGKGLGEFCEVMVGKVDRKDFVVLDADVDLPPTVITF